MFDFGNKKLIGMLEKEIDKLHREKKEFVKTVEYLTNKIDELNGKIKELTDKTKELEDELEKEKIGIKCGYGEINLSITGDDNKKRNCYRARDYSYIETRQDMMKKYGNLEDYRYTYFINKDSKEIIQPNEIDNSHYDKIIKMYSRIPYRTFQDLCFINEFLESNNYVNYRDECSTEQILSHVTREMVGDKLVYRIYGRRINDFVREFEKVRNGMNRREGIIIYKQRTLPKFYSNIFESEKEFMKEARQLIYDRIEIGYKIKNWNC